MTSTNLNIVLTNALCCSARLATEVSKLYSIGSKCADAELTKLKLLNDYIETLRCYKIDSVNSKFRYRVLYDFGFQNLSNNFYTYTVTVNNVSQSLPGDGVKKIYEIILDVLALFDNIVSYSFTDDYVDADPRYSYLNIEALCDVIIINIDDSSKINIDITPYQTGICTVTNCLTDLEYQKLIEYVMSTCDICECQLNQ